MDAPDAYGMINHVYDRTMAGGDRRIVIVFDERTFRTRRQGGDVLGWVATAICYKNRCGLWLLKRPRRLFKKTPKP
jgi:hypothetical protein